MQTKPGRYGTLKRYCVNYRSDTDPDGLCLDKWQCWGYSIEHAIDKFNDESTALDGWIAVSVDLVK